jgi:hypothetical protein
MTASCVIIIASGKKLFSLSADSHTTGLHDDDSSIARLFYVRKFISLSIKSKLFKCRERASGLTNVNDEANPHKLVRDGNETGKDPLNFHLALKCQ